MGDLAIQADISKLPDFSEIDVESCYLGWDLILNTSASLEEIKEVFAWVEGDCTLSITNDDDRRVKSDRRSQEEVKKSGRRQTDSAVRVKQELTSIRVSTDKVDNLLNLVGELVITQSMLTRVISDLNVSEAEKLDETLEILERNTRDLQEHTMSIRMLPIDVAFQRLPRVVHDLSQLLGKKVEIKLFGESTELDKTVLEKIGDPLVHMVRNALDHGLESPEVRIAAGKPETGTIKVSAHHLGSSIVVEIEDDGAGINTEKVLKKAIERGLVAEGDNPGDAEIHNMIFQPGFSTANEVSDISGRGVGMDVVKRNITDLGGTVELQSKTNVGSRVTIRLPLTLAILDGQMVRVADQVYIVPLHSIIETLQVETERIKGIAQQAELYQYRDEYIPVIRLCSLFNLDCDEASSGQALLVVIDLGGRRVGLYVNDVIGQQQVVIKSLESNYKHVEGLAGATVLGDGSVALILDVVGLSQQASCMNIEETVC